LSLANTSTSFAYFRKEIQVPQGVVSAAAFVTARNDDPLLAGYKLFLNGATVDVGPGRGEAPVWGGDGIFRSLPYTTLEVSSYFDTQGAMVLALETMKGKGPSVMLEVRLTLDSGKVITIGTDATWLAFNGDVHRKPGKPEGKGHDANSAGTGFIEYIDARNEPIDWMLSSFRATSAWRPAVATEPSTADAYNLHSKMEPPLQLTSIPVTTIRPVSGAAGGGFLADFGKEFQGGLRLHVQDGTAGQTVHIACGEALSKDKPQQVTSTWGWEFDWTLRSGEQLLEQHKYMECRFVSLVFSGAHSNFTLSAWKVNYPYDSTDSHFESSNATLDAVYEISRYTLEAASLDTYTDSNTRERRPYEADGIIAATARLLIQRDYLWPRHSHAWVINDPTWPVEWKQLSSFLGWQDYMATGQPDLALAFREQMHARTMIGFLDPASGLLNTDKMGRHIVDWMPDGRETDETVQRGEFTASNHTSVSNAFCVHGLDLLSQMMAAGGAHENATTFAAESKSLGAAMVNSMWNGTAFC